MDFIDLVEKAENNNIQAQYKLSLEYEKLNKQKNAEFWLKKSANQGYELARLTLSVLQKQETKLSDDEVAGSIKS